MPRSSLGPPEEIQAIRAEIDRVLNLTDADGRRVGDCQHGVYAFYDYDGEPIYVGQTKEQLRTRIRRHLTNQRTDAVAMNVLDPFQVAEVEMWPFWALDGEPEPAVKNALDRAEYAVFERSLAVLNEKPVVPCAPITLPPSKRAHIVPEPIFGRRKHSDVRIARRAATIAKLAQVISERDVSPGLRRTLLTQARRLEHLAAIRLRELAPDYVTTDDRPAFALVAEAPSELGHPPPRTRTPKG